ncbi:MAG: DUF1257 domain-containing protein [Deltaproteobacteria bacterium]|nr:DUF1257 domain-containing protein [Deltaproteobacteria bacterium]
MSHFTQVKTLLRNKDTLIKALKAMGHTVVEEADSVKVRGFMGDTETADFKILTDTHYDIGFRRLSDGTYELVGDWDVLPKASGIERETFARTLKKQYAQVAISEIAKQQGYEVESHEQQDGSIEMVVTQW